MTTVTITADDARTLLTRAVEEKGADYIYPRANHPDGCLYFEGDAPSCIVGHVFAYKGMKPLPEDYNGSTVSGLASYERFFSVDGRRTLRALASAQGTQDAGEPWGDALAIALEILDRSEAES